MSQSSARKSGCRSASCAASDTPRSTDHDHAGRRTSRRTPNSAARPVRNVDLLDGTITLFVLGLGAGALALVAIARQKHGLAIGLLIASFAAISLIAMFFIALLIVLDSA